MSTITAALRDRRFLISSWPWRSLAYLLTTALVVTPIALLVWLVALPWLAAASSLRDGHPPKVAVVVLMAVGVVVVACFGPLVAVPLAALERRRLAILDDRPIRTAHQSVADPVAWLRVRYTEAATWREVVYGLILSLAVPVVYGLLGLAALLIGGFIVSPAFVGNGMVAWQAGPVEIRGTGPAVLLAVVGLVLIVPLVYLVALLVAGQGAAARALLGGGAGTRLREVDRSAVSR